MTRKFRTEVRVIVSGCPSHGDVTYGPEQDSNYILEEAREDVRREIIHSACVHSKGCKHRIETRRISYWQKID